MISAADVIEADPLHTRLDLKRPHSVIGEKSLLLYFT